MRFYPFVFTSTDEGGIAAYYNYAGTDLCASREQSQACLSYAETKQSVRSNRVAARLGSGGLSYDATCVTDNGEVAKRSDELFWNGVKLLNEHKAKPEDFKEMSLVDAKGKEVDWLKKIDLDKLVMSWQLEAKIDPWKIHAVIDDNSYPAMPGNIRYENEPDVFFYHSDHLGGASWITDADGKPIQHLQYLPFGEPFVNQHPAGYQERFTFTGKERDEETGYGYFGARYMDYTLMTSFISVDRYASKYPFISPYAYCAWNPIKVIDPMGTDTINTTDPSKPESKQLSKACNSSYPGMIIVNGHGLVPEDSPSSPSTTIKFQNNRYSMENGAVNMQRSTTIDVIADFLKQYNGVYEENSKKGLLTVVILVVCRAGTEFQITEHQQDNIAQTLSKEMPNAIIIAPSWDVTLKYKSKDNNMNVYKDPYRHMSGHWNVYREGKKLDELPNYTRLNSLVRVVKMKEAFVYRLLIP